MSGIYEVRASYFRVVKFDLSSTWMTLAIDVFPQPTNKTMFWHAASDVDPRT